MPVFYIWILMCIMEMGLKKPSIFTDRVMTVSFHKYGDMFFPRTGDVKIIAKVVETNLPGAIVLQCGADFLAGNHLGSFNLSIDGHAECVRFVKKINLMLLVTGGGGYTKDNIARCWTVETGAQLETKVPNGMENLNSKSYIGQIKAQVFENLRCVQHAPSVLMHGRSFLSKGNRENGTKFCYGGGCITIHRISTVHSRQANST